MNSGSSETSGRLKPRTKRRKRDGVALIACNRCKSRKQKCDGDYLDGKTCSNCIKAGILCQYDEKKSQDYVGLLQQKIDHLEQKVRILQYDQQISNLRASASSAKDGDNQNQDKIEIQTTSCNDFGSSLVHCAAFIPLKNDTEPLYIGSPGFNIATLLQYSLVNEPNQSVSDSRQLSKRNSSPEDGSVFNKPSSPSSTPLSELLQDHDLTTSYIKNYLGTVHSRYPFLQKCYIELLDEGKSSLLTDCTDTSDNVNGNRLVMDRFILLMVYAIGARLRPAKKTTTRGDHEGEDNHLVFYKTALSLNLSAILRSENISNIHAILLLVIYHLRFPNGSVIWHLICSALRMCVCFGLHRRNLKLFNENPYFYLIRCRTFWSAYSLERVISNSFGRPYSISDRDIDIDIPIDIDESITDEVLIKKKFYKTYPQYNFDHYDISNLNEKESRTTISLAIQYFRLRKIDSKIQSTIYRVDKVFEHVPRETILQFQKAMKNWITTLPSFLTSSEYDYCLYLFNKQIRSLIQPFINKLSSYDPLFSECMKSSLTICNLSKRIHQRSNYRLSFVSLQTVFLSGVTIIYGLLFEKITWNFEVSEGLRSCTSVLFLLAERSPSCHKYRDVFEKLVDRVNAVRQARHTAMNSEPVLRDSITSSKTEGHSQTYTSGSRSPGSDVSSSPINLDLFGQSEIKRKVHESHMRENLMLFNEITGTDNEDDLRQFDSFIDFPNLDELFQNLWCEDFNPSDWSIDLI